MNKWQALTMCVIMTCITVIFVVGLLTGGIR